MLGGLAITPARESFPPQDTFWSIINMDYAFADSGGLIEE
jgi:hypothetical protein